MRNMIGTTTLGAIQPTPEQAADRAFLAPGQATAHSALFVSFLFSFVVVVLSHGVGSPGPAENEIRVDDGWPYRRFGRGIG
ncbi:uncharacterized protein BDV17DRAFT_257392 [Aspergillus undulatus]|uniref:uncharacterized protein n=1 Tax=Aspergillus undulatus TaxID=1810928 RepID=UPI003CCE20C7